MNNKQKTVRFAALAVVLTVLISMLAVPAAAKGNTAKDAAEGVVRVLVMNPVTGEPAGLGTAFGIGKKGEDPRYFVTTARILDVEVGEGKNAAVLEATQFYLMKTDTAVSYNGYQKTFVLEKSQLIPCELIYRNEDKSDLAILKAAEPFAGKTALPLRAPDAEKDLGAQIFALGFPNGIKSVGGEAASASVSFPASAENVEVKSGTISRISDDFIEHDGVGDPGTAGGPLIDENGKVIGVNTRQNAAKEDAVSAQCVMDLCEELEIPYDTGSVNKVILIAAGAAVVAIIVLGAVLIRRKKIQSVTFTLVGVRGFYAGQEITLDKDIKMGREPVKGATQLFPSNAAGVSGVHCALTIQKGKLYLEDLNSSYGTFVYKNGTSRRIFPGNPEELCSGDAFWLGSEQQQFRVQ